MHNVCSELLPFKKSWKHISALPCCRVLSRAAYTIWSILIMVTVCKERQKWIVEVAASWTLTVNVRLERAEQRTFQDLFSRISEAHEGRLTKQQFVYHVTNSDRIATCFSHLGTGLIWLGRQRVFSKRSF